MKTWSYKEEKIANKNGNSKQFNDFETKNNIISINLINLSYLKNVINYFFHFSMQFISVYATCF